MSIFNQHDINYRRREPFGSHLMTQLDRFLEALTLDIYSKLNYIKMNRWMVHQG